MTQGSSNRALLFGKPMEMHVDLWKFPYPIHSLDVFTVCAGFPMQSTFAFVTIFSIKIFPLFGC